MIDVSAASISKAERRAAELNSPSYLPLSNEMVKALIEMGMYTADDILHGFFIVSSDSYEYLMELAGRRQ